MTLKKKFFEKHDFEENCFKKSMIWNEKVFGKIMIFN